MSRKFIFGLATAFLLGIAVMWGYEQPASPTRFGSVSDVLKVRIHALDTSNLPVPLIADNSGRLVVNSYPGVAYADLSFTSPNTLPATIYMTTTGLAGYRNASVYAALQGATGGTLDVYLQYSPDGGTTWVDMGHFTQLASGGAAIKHRVSWTREGNQALTTVGAGTSPVLAAGTFLNGDFGDRLRVLAVPGAGTTTGTLQSLLFTFSQ